jgi:hypothetical protein
MSQRDVELTRDFNCDATYWLLPVNMLMRIYMCRIFAGKATESRKLAMYLFDYFPEVIGRDYFIKSHPSPIAVDPFTEIKMKTEAKAWMLAAICCGSSGVWPAHHQTGACHNPALMRIDNAPIYAYALAEIISIDYQIPLGSHSFKAPTG